MAMGVRIAWGHFPTKDVRVQRQAHLSAMFGGGWWVCCRCYRCCLGVQDVRGQMTDTDGPAQRSAARARVPRSALEGPRYPSQSRFTLRPPCRCDPEQGASGGEGEGDTPQHAQPRALCLAAHKPCPASQ